VKAAKHEKHDRSDPEEWYRRGYVHGAWHLYRALLPFLPDDTRETAYQWITTDLATWRTQKRSDIGTIEGEIADATPAPRARLNKLKPKKTKA
jgi:hypothetical protein